MLRNKLLLRNQLTPTKNPILSKMPSYTKREYNESIKYNIKGKMAWINYYFTISVNFQTIQTESAIGIIETKISRKKIV